MDYLWTPWRYAYISAASKDDGKSSECTFCELPKRSDEESKIVYRVERCFIILNSLPYTSGHMIVVTFAHLDELQKMFVTAAHKMLILSQKMQSVHRNVYSR